MFFALHASSPAAPPSEGEVLSESGKSRFRSMAPPAGCNPSRRAVRRRAATADRPSSARGHFRSEVDGGDPAPRRLRRKAARNPLLPTEIPARGRGARLAALREKGILSGSDKGGFRPVAPPVAGGAERLPSRREARRRAAAPILPRGASQGDFVRTRREPVPVAGAIAGERRGAPSVPAGCPAPGGGIHPAPSREGTILSESDESGFRVTALSATGDAGRLPFRRKARRRAAPPIQPGRARRAFRPNAAKGDPTR